MFNERLGNVRRRRVVISWGPNFTPLPPSEQQFKWWSFLVFRQFRFYGLNWADFLGSKQADPLFAGRDIGGVGVTIGVLTEPESILTDILSCLFVDFFY